ncbi:MAG: WD40 repeat domain-containing serine/threonine protein kinase [Planctomycetaceae bacterium]
MKLSREDLETVLRVGESSGLLTSERAESVRLLSNRDTDFEPAVVAEASGLSEFQVRQAASGGLLTVGPYVLLDCIGRGGMGVVFRARHAVMQRDVAVKVLQFSPADTTLLEGQELQAHRRFQREIESLASLRHPNIVEAYDAGRDGRVAYLAMELLDGTNLAQHVRENGPLDCKKACEITATVLDALHHAHQQGMVHRDVKPSNMMLTPSGVKLLDLGLASSMLSSGAEVTLTETGSVLGTPDFLAPEQAIDSASAGPAADQYGAGASLYFLLTGEPPFPGRTATEKLLKHQTESPQCPSRLEPEIPSSVDNVVLRLLAKEPGNRFDSAAEASSAIRESISAPMGVVQKRSRRRLFAVMAGVIVVAAALLGWSMRPSASGSDSPIDQVPKLASERVPEISAANDSSHIAAASNAHFVDAVFLKEGSLLAMAWMDLRDPRLPGSVIVWDTNQGTVVREMSTDGPIMSLAVSPDGSTMIASGGHLNFPVDGGIHILEVDGPVATWSSRKIDGHEGGTSGILWLSDTDFLSFRSRQTPLNEPLIYKHSLTSVKPVAGLAPSSRSCSVARRIGDYLVLGEYPGCVTVRDAATMEEVFAAETEYSSVFDIAEVDGGRVLIATGEQDGNRGAIYSLTLETGDFQCDKVRSLEGTPVRIFRDGKLTRWCSGNGARVRTGDLKNGKLDEDWSVGRWLWFDLKHPTRDEYFLGSDEGELFAADSWGNIRSLSRFGLPSEAGGP